MRARAQGGQDSYRAGYPGGERNTDGTPESSAEHSLITAQKRNFPKPGEENTKKD